MNKVGTLEGRNGANKISHDLLYVAPTPAVPVVEAKQRLSITAAMGFKQEYRIWSSVAK